MTSVPREFPLSYAVRSEGRRCGSVSAVHESNPAGPLIKPHPSRPPDPPPAPRHPGALRCAAEEAVQDRGAPPRPRFAHGQIVGLRVAFADVAVRDRVKQAGGTWNPERRVWQLRYDRVGALGLNGRIVDEPASNSGCQGSSGENLHADARATFR